MTWLDVAVRDARDAGRSTGIWLLGGAQTLLFVGAALVQASDGGPFLAYVDRLAGVAAVTLPLVAVLVGYRSILGERTTGQLRLVLSMPHSRRDLAAGKLAGRAVVFAAPTLVALCLAVAVAAALADGPAAWLRLPWFVGATTLYGVAFVGLAVGVSLSTAAVRRVAVGAVGAYLATVVLWRDLHTAALLILHRFDTAATTSMSGPVLLVRLLSPRESYDLLVRTAVAVDRAGRYADGAAYLTWATALVVLLAWTVVPVALGYRRFRSADL